MAKDEGGEGGFNNNSRNNKHSAPTQEQQELWQKQLLQDQRGGSGFEDFKTRAN